MEYTCFASITKIARHPTRHLNNSTDGTLSREEHGAWDTGLLLAPIQTIHSLSCDVVLDATVSTNQWTTRPLLHDQHRSTILS